jgi:hypothetical protein
MFLHIPAISTHLLLHPVGAGGVHGGVSLLINKTIYMESYEIRKAYSSKLKRQKADS